VKKKDAVKYTGIIFNIGYGLVLAIISSIQLSFFMGITGLCCILYGLIKLYAIYRQHKGMDTSKSARHISIGAATMSFLHFSIAIVCIFFMPDDPSVYGLFIICLVSSVCFLNLFSAIFRLIITHKDKGEIYYHLAWVSLANALIGLSLLQRATLFFAMGESARLYAGIGGIVFGVAAFAICLILFLKHYDKSRTRNFI